MTIAIVSKHFFESRLMMTEVVPAREQETATATGAELSNGGLQRLDFDLYKGYTFPLNGGRFTPPKISRLLLPFKSGNARIRNAINTRFPNRGVEPMMLGPGKYKLDIQPFLAIRDLVLAEPMENGTGTGTLLVLSKKDFSSGRLRSTRAQLVDRIGTTVVLNVASAAEVQPKKVNKLKKRNVPAAGT